MQYLMRATFLLHMICLILKIVFLLPSLHCQILEIPWRASNPTVAQVRRQPKQQGGVQPKKTLPFLLSFCGPSAKQKPPSLFSLCSPNPGHSSPCLGHSSLCPSFGGPSPSTSFIHPRTAPLIHHLGRSYWTLVHQPSCMVPQLLGKTLGP